MFHSSKAGMIVAINAWQPSNTETMEAIESSMPRANE